MRRSVVTALAIATISTSGTANAQEPATWGADLRFHTFSIAAIDPETGESGVAVTTRVACVGNGVPWVRAGVGAVATQAFTRTAYGHELLALMADGLDAGTALQRSVAADSLRDQRQVGVIGLDGSSGQHTGDSTFDWAGHRSGPNYVTQGNLLVGPEVTDAVARAFEASAGTHRHLADRLIEALAAGQSAGGDARKGRVQSAAVVVADPREGRSRRPDGITVNINVCEHPTPVAELRRVYDTISQTLGYRSLFQARGADVWQLKVILHALGYFRPEAETLERDGDAFLYTAETVAAVDAFRVDHDLTTAALGSPPGLVDAETVQLFWSELDRLGTAAEIRERLKEVVAVRR